MSTPEGETDAPTNVPETGRRRTIWPNLVWGIPLAALLIVGYLGVRALFNRGEVVTVTFSRAAGAKAGMTKVLYQGIEAGQLIKIGAGRMNRAGEVGFGVRAKALQDGLLVLSHAILLVRSTDLNRRHSIRIDKLVQDEILSWYKCYPDFENELTIA